MVEAAFNKAFEEKRDPRILHEMAIFKIYFSSVECEFGTMQNAKKVGNETFLEFFKHSVLFYSSYFFALTCMYLDAK